MVAAVGMAKPREGFGGSQCLCVSFCAPKPTVHDSPSRANTEKGCKLKGQVTFFMQLFEICLTPDIVKSDSQSAQQSEQ